MVIVEDFAKVRVLCVGDVMVDCFVGGAVKRISPESPVPVFSVDAREIFPGGAANVARNIAALGGGCTLIGVVGDDEAARHLTADLSATTNIRPAFAISPDRPTTEKTRFVAQGQHVLRVDREIAGPISPAIAKDLLALVGQHIGDHDVLVLSDYAKGVLTDEIIQTSIALAKAKGIPIVVDPKSKDLARYRGATVITPNSKEIEAATGIDPSHDDAAAVAAAGLGMEQAGSEAILVTRAEKGMTLVQRDAAPVHIASCAREVFDVVGAGDTVIATLSLALGLGSNLEGAARAANVAAGIAVGRRGTSTVSQSELLDEMTKTDMTGKGLHAEKILNQTEIVLRVQAWKRDGLRVGFTNGCFDILHLGHIRLLKFCRQNCDRLILGINSDASVRRLKGPDRPINPEADRAEVLAALGTIDAVIVFDEDTPLKLIELVEPDVLIKGADYAIGQIVGADLVMARGGKVLRFELVPGKSSTDLISKSKAKKDGAS